MEASKLSGNKIIVSDIESHVIKKQTGLPSLPLKPGMHNLVMRKLIIGFVYKHENAPTIVGIDPGYSNGLAILFAGHVICTDVVYSVEKLILKLKLLLKVLKSDTVRIKIGNGAIPIRDKIFDLMVKEFPQFPVSIVDERRTSIRNGSDRSRHEEAAIIIAKRSSSTS